MQVSIIIVNYNTTGFVRECVRSIIDCTQNILFEIIVVDNLSPDRSIENLTIEFPFVKLINHTANAGFGTANNIGSRHASGEFLFFLNPDTLLRSNAVKELYDFYRSDENLRIGALGTLLRDDRMQPNASYSERFITFSEEIRLGVSSHFVKSIPRKEREENKIFKEVAWVSGADLFIKADTFKEVGGFDENIFMYYEETDLQFRLRKSGYKNYIIFSPKIIHLEGGSFKKEISVKQKMFIDKSKLYYYKKHSNSNFIYSLNKAVYLAMTFLNLYLKFGSAGVKQYINHIQS